VFNRVFCLQSVKVNLRRWLTELTNSEGSNQSTVKHRSRIEINSVESEEYAGQKSQVVKFICCKIVKRLTVVPPGEHSNK
jgi:predicted Zn-dependent protease